MEKLITSCVTLLLCQLVSFGQICSIDLGEDQRTCEFQDTLIGMPSGGSWAYLYTDTTAIIAFEVLNDSSTLITFSKCGSYIFEYSIFDALCTPNIISDTLQIDFENPAIVNYNVDVGIDLQYKNYECQQDTSVACAPFTIVGASPKPVWTFFPRSGNCAGNSFETTISDSVFNCITDTINITANNHNGTIGSGEEMEFCQDDILVLENEAIASDVFYGIIFQSGNKGLDSLITQCPFPNQCFYPPSPECIDSVIYDTSQMIIPLHLGGEWQVAQDNQLIQLDSNNIFTIDTTDYLLNVSPTPQTYAATFEIKEITPTGDTVSLSNIITMDFQWVENWATDTVQYIDSTLIISDSCCIGGAIIEYTHDPAPPVPEYECPSFSVEFIPALLASSPQVICDDSSYVVVIELSQGIPPYNYTGTSGTINGNIFTSDMISIDSIFYEFEFTDSGSCEKTVNGEICPCLWGGNPPVIELTTYDDCATNSIGSLNIENLSNAHPPYLYSIDGINFQEATFFDNVTTGLYELTVKDSFNCIVTDDFLIENIEFENLDLSSTSSDYSICRNENILLEGLLSSTDSTLQVLWDNGNTEFNQTVNQSGTYVAAVYDLEECTTYTNTFNVENIPLPPVNDIKIPNVFTPDNDGINDFYNPIIDEELTVTNYNLSIFNRWGQRVFHSTDRNKKWEPDNDAFMGVYVWMLDLELVNCTGENIYFKDSGDLTLIR